jgi:hypothetical protein
VREISRSSRWGGEIRITITIRTPDLSSYITTETRRGKLETVTLMRFMLFEVSRKVATLPPQRRSAPECLHLHPPHLPFSQV